MWVTPSGNQIPPTANRISDIMDRPDDFRVLERVPLDRGEIPMEMGRSSKGDTIITLLDTETTGTEDVDKVIELGMIRCRYNAGRLVGVEATYDEFDDPGMPIPLEVTAMTGITDDMVRGRRINADIVAEWLGEDPLIVAHNAAFDRPFFERRFPGLGDYRWACSLKDIPWRDAGYASASLPLLLAQEGWFHAAHRANADCMALAWLLHLVDGSVDELVASAATTMERVFAGGNSYHVKDQLKARGYRWNGTRWWRDVESGMLDGELRYLKALYPGGVASTHLTLDARSRFK